MQQAAHSPCSAPSAAERTACFGAQSFRNSSGISFSREGSITCAAVLRHTVSVASAARDTCMFDLEAQGSDLIG